MEGMVKRRTIIVRRAGQCFHTILNIYVIKDWEYSYIGDIPRCLVRDRRWRVEVNKAIGENGNDNKRKRRWSSNRRVIKKIDAVFQNWDSILPPGCIRNASSNQRDNSIE